MGLLPGSTIGILGGGQLGRMTAQAARQLGYHTHIFSPQKESCAMAVADHATVGDYHDQKLLAQFADAVDVMTLEFENVPVESLVFLSRYKNVRPGADILRVTQDRVLEKDFVQAQHIGTAPYRAVKNLDDLRAAIVALGTPSILKTARFGYDGKGQVKISDPRDADAAWDAVGKQDCVLEGFVDFEREISVIVARTPSGQVHVYPPVDNMHENHILRETHAPSSVAKDVADRAVVMATTLAQAFQLQGLLAIEMFVLPDGNLLVNEMAPRPHNSGHWTMDGCVTSQFEQLVRAVCDLPLGSVDVKTPTVMRNLLGTEISDVSQYKNDPTAMVHDYEKGEPRPWRKMGHVNFIGKR